MRATMHWPRSEQRGPGQREKGMTEIRSVPIDFDTVRTFLLRSGGYQVDDDEHYYRRVSSSSTAAEGVNVVRVQIAVKGDSPDASTTTTLSYRDVTFLYDLAERVWPGAQ